MSKTALPPYLLYYAIFLLGSGVALGAFGAHGLKESVDAKDLAIFETGVKYQMWHGLALLILALQQRYPQTNHSFWAQGLLAWGIMIFSGSLYLLVLLQQRWLGAITPVGGVAMIAGWTLLFVWATRCPRQRD